MRYFLLMLLLLLCHNTFAQNDSIPRPKEKDSSLFRKSANTQNISKPPTEVISIKNYKIISHARDTVFLDTTLSMAKEYKFNYLRKDDFELMPFTNVGQPYNHLGVDLDRNRLYPQLGAKARHFNYFEIEDIPYFNVATPMTELFFKTTFEQGQMLDALLAFNTSRKLNFSLAFKGFRSLGKYQFSQGQSGNFRASTNYQTENERYTLRAHIAMQNIEGEENGGLLKKELQFESGNPEFSDRSRLDVVFMDAGNRVNGKRYYLDHSYQLIKNKLGIDSLQKRTTGLAIGHELSYESKFYQFTQEAQDDYFGDSFLSPIEDKATLKVMTNQLRAEFYNRTLGRLTGFTNLYNYNYFFNSVLITETEEIQNQLKGEEIIVGADYFKEIGKFSLKGKAAYTVVGDLSGSFIDLSASFQFNEDMRMAAALHTSSRKPDFNYLLYQSEYSNYNWQNTEQFGDASINSLQFSLQSVVWGNLMAKYTTTDNYTYFASEATQEQIDLGQENAFVKPFQEGNSVGLLKVKYEKEFKWRKWALNNTFMYQQVSQTNNVLNLPEFVTRNTLYYSDEVFKKAMFLQTGVTFKYFTKYYMDGYNPALAEFYTQNVEELGGFPMFDFFINAKVRQMRIFLKAEHFNSSFTGFNYYAAPNYPYRDFVIRFGVVWNFFS